MPLGLSDHISITLQQLTTAVEVLQNVIPKFTHKGNFNGVHMFGQ